MKICYKNTIKQFFELGIHWPHIRGYVDQMVVQSGIKVDSTTQTLWDFLALNAIHSHCLRDQIKTTEWLNEYDLRCYQKGMYGSHETTAQPIGVNM